MTIDRQAQYETSIKNINRYNNRQWSMIIILAIGTLALLVAPTTAAFGTITCLFIIIAN